MTPAVDVEAEPAERLVIPDQKVGAAGELDERAEPALEIGALFPGSAIVVGTNTGDLKRVMTQPPDDERRRVDQVVDLFQLLGPVPARLRLACLDLVGALQPYDFIAHAKIGLVCLPIGGRYRSQPRRLGHEGEPISAFRRPLIRASCFRRAPVQCSRCRSRRRAARNWRFSATR